MPSLPDAAPRIAPRADASGEDERPTAFHCEGLAATVYSHVDAGQFATELDDLYSSLFSTVDWFETHDTPPWVGACILERPRHVLLFTGAGDTVEVLNKTIAIAPADVDRACQALLSCFPHVRRIHLEVLFAPAALRLPKRILYETDHMVVDLPATQAEYVAALGKSTRTNLRRYERRLMRDFPDLTTEVLSADDARVPALFEQLLEWKTRRFEKRRRTTYWKNDPTLAERFLTLLRRRGEVRVTSLEGTPVAITCDFPVGSCLCAQEAASDPEFDRYRLGLLSDYWVICDAIRRGFDHVNLLWGTQQHKAHFLATPRRCTALSVFRDQRSRLHFLDEAWEVARRTSRRRGERHYWRARRAAGAHVRGRRQRRADRDAERSRQELLRNLENTYCRIRSSEGKGVGVFAIRDIPAGVDLFLGPKPRRWIKINMKDVGHLPQAVQRMIDDFCIIQSNGDVMVYEEGFNGLHIRWFANHSATPNLTTADEALSFTTLREVAVGEELTYDYAAVDSNWSTRGHLLSLEAMPGPAISPGGGPRREEGT